MFNFKVRVLDLNVVDASNEETHVDVDMCEYLLWLCSASRHLHLTKQFPMS